MGFFGKKEQKNKKSDAVEEQASKPAEPKFLAMPGGGYKAYLGVEDVFTLEGDTEDLIVVGKLVGSLKVGSTIYIKNVGDEESKTFATALIGMENGPDNKVDFASDCNVAMRILKGKQANIHKGTVVSTNDVTEKELKDAYINALGNSYVQKMDLDIDKEEYEKLTLTDCLEIWRLYIWFKSKVQQMTQEDMEKVRERLGKHAEVTIGKLLEAKSVYTLICKATGEPYMFSRTYEGKDNNYECTPPDILVFTASELAKIKSAYPEDEYEYKLIENGANKKGIRDFLSSAFYLNGASGLCLQSNDVGIDRSRVVEEPDLSKVPEVNRPVSNPNLVRWMLLIGQMGELDTKEKETIFQLYYRFMIMEMATAKYIIPMKHTDADGNPVEVKNVIEAGVTMQLATQDGRDGKDAIRMYTDWKRFSMVYGKEWEGVVQTVGDVIEKFDCAINSTIYYKAGCYISKEVYESAKALV